MKKIVKRLGAAAAALCLAAISFSFITFAAEGTLAFSDPTAAAGENVTVTARVSTGGAAIGDTAITVTYDTSILKFVSGTNVTGEDGTLQLSGTGDGTSSEASYSMEFTALKEGTASVQATTYTAYLYSDEALNLSLGSASVTIQGGTPVSGAESGSSGKASTGGLQVDVDGKSYTVNVNFSEAAVPNGFTATDMELNGTATKAMVQEQSGQYMFYLEDESGNSDYFLYSTDDGSFTQTEVVDVNTDLSIYLMNHEDKEGLPGEYQETTTDIGGKVFTAWQNTSQQEYYLVYALSSVGSKGYYQYDTTEKTYQRYTVPTVQEEETGNSLTDKVMGFLEKYLTIIMCVVWGVILLLLIIIIILAVKLSHRNQELDDLYDEYGLDAEGGGDGDDVPRVAKKSRQQFAGFSDAKEDEYEDDEYDDEYADDEYDGYDDYDDGYGDDGYEDDDYDEYSDEDGYDEYEEYEEEPVRKSKKKKDDYSMDFIDI